MVCLSKNVKLYRACYIPASGNYGDKLDLTDLATIFSARKDIKVLTGASELNIEQQEIVLENYGDKIRDDVSFHTYYKVTGGSITTPHHVDFAVRHQALLKSGLGSLQVSVSDLAKTTTVSTTTGANPTSVDLTDAGGLPTGKILYKIGDHIRIGEALGIGTSLDFAPAISGTVAEGTTITPLQSFDPQCKEDDSYFHFLVWAADEYWLLEWVKPAFAIESNDGGVPKKWVISLTASQARRVTSDEVGTLITGLTPEKVTGVVTTTNKVNIAIDGTKVTDVVSLSMEVSRQNERWETDVNETGSIGSINDIESITGVLHVFKNKETYHTWKETNDTKDVFFTSSDNSYAVYAPAVKLVGGENPIQDSNNQTVASFSVVWNDDHEESIYIYMGELA